jgi:DNA/RNA-binding domain of Phe-tRNA-synthetase-like protein
VLITLEPHSLLDCRAFVTRFAEPLCNIDDWPAVAQARSGDFAAPVSSSDEVRKAIRNLLRVGGFKPTGRNKPSSEYLLKVAADGPLLAINAAVDAGNAVALHSGLPVSVVDLDKTREPLRVGIAEKGLRYVFNPSGQVIDVGGLLCLNDAEGPCANAVRDAQRTKTGPGTTRTLSIIWGNKTLSARCRAAMDWYRDLLGGAGAEIDEVRFEQQAGEAE